jgi:SsrA-binding protein
MAAGSRSGDAKRKAMEPTIENRRARHDYAIEQTLECGIKLAGTEVKSVRQGQVSLNEGFARASAEPLELTLHDVHIGEYGPAGPRQHTPARPRVLLAQRREIRKLAEATQSGGVTLIPLKVYFVRGRVKVLLGVARGKKRHDKRQAIAEREVRRDIDRVMRRRA